MPIDFCDQLESEFNTMASCVTGPKFRAVCQRWLECFCQNVKKNTGGWVYKGIRWHAYSFDHELSLCGSRAFSEYQSMPIQPFFIFHESDDQLFDCTSASWPDLRGVGGDIYIFPHAMNWTFVCTHEMSIGLGPYFASPSR